MHPLQHRPAQLFVVGGDPLDWDDLKEGPDRADVTAGRAAEMGQHGTVTLSGSRCGRPRGTQGRARLRGHRHDPVVGLLTMRETESDSAKPRDSG